MTTHQGRYGRREAGKDVRSYSAAALATILGVGPAPSAPAPPPAAAANAEAAEAGAGRRRVVVEVRVPDELRAERAAYRPPPLAPDWWGAQKFTRQGVLAGAPDPDDAADNDADAAAEGRAEAGRSRPEGFREEDQEKVYNDAQSAKTGGRKGLGWATASGGGNLGRDFAGAKTTFNSASSSDSEPEPEAAPAPEALEGQQRLRQDEAMAKVRGGPSPCTTCSAGGLTPAAPRRCATQALVKVLRKRKGGPVRVKALRRKVRAPPAVPVFRVLGTDY